MKHEKHWHCSEMVKTYGDQAPICCVCNPHEGCKDYSLGKKLDIESGNLKEDYFEVKP